MLVREAMDDLWNALRYGSFALAEGIAGDSERYRSRSGQVNSEHVRGVRSLGRELPENLRTAERGRC